MGTEIDDLEEQIRAAFRYRADQLPTAAHVPPLLDAQPVYFRERPVQARRYALLAAALVLAIVGSVGIILASSDSSDRSPQVASFAVSLSQVPDGVSVQQFGKRLVFVVRNGDEVRVFDTKVHHLAGENVLWWCPNERFFVAPTHGETFSRSGRAIGGPARSGLDQLKASVRRGELIVDLNNRTPGITGNSHKADGTGTSISPWDSGPSSFCAGALKASNGAPTAVLDVEALATVQYDKKVYDVPAGLIEVRFRGATGILFTFDDSRYRYCLLATDRGARRTCRVYLSPGDYRVYDSVPGHQQAGYDATIHVTGGPTLPADTAPSWEGRFSPPLGVPGDTITLTGATCDTQPTIAWAQTDGTLLTDVVPFDPPNTTTVVPDVLPGTYQVVVACGSTGGGFIFTVTAPDGQGEPSP
jgi:hypothetical protein